MSFEKVYAVLRNCVAISVFALAVIGFLAVSTARAQQVAVAEIDGYVTDPSGQAIVGAQVKATDLDRGQVRTNATDATGRYSFPNLSIGNYQLEVSAPGFKTYVQKGIQLEVASNPQINVRMEIGAVTESVQVNANAAQVETKENSIAQVVDEQRLIDLPLNGRNPADLLRITGFSTSAMNVNGNDLTGSKNIQGSNGSGAYSVAGSAANGVNFLLDGGDNNDAFSNVNLPIASGRRGQHRDQVRLQRPARRRVLVSPQLQAERAAQGDGAFATSPRLSEAQPVRRHGRRPYHQGQAVLLRRLPGHAAAQRSVDLDGL
jgi:hypothetical protein